MGANEKRSTSSSSFPRSCLLELQLLDPDMFVCLLQGVQEIANSYVDQQQEKKVRGDEIAICDTPCRDRCFVFLTGCASMSSHPASKTFTMLYKSAYITSSSVIATFDIDIELPHS